MIRDAVFSLFRVGLLRVSFQIASSSLDRWRDLKAKAWPCLSPGCLVFPGCGRLPVCVHFDVVAQTPLFDPRVAGFSVHCCHEQYSAIISHGPFQGVAMAFPRFAICSCSLVSLSVISALLCSLKRFPDRVLYVLMMCHLVYAWCIFSGFVHLALL